MMVARHRRGRDNVKAWLLAVSVALAAVIWAVTQLIKAPLSVQIVAAALAAGVPLVTAQLKEIFRQDDENVRIWRTNLRLYGRRGRRRGPPTVAAATKELSSLNVS